MRCPKVTPPVRQAVGSGAQALRPPEALETLGGAGLVALWGRGPGS